MTTTVVTTTGIIIRVGESGARTRSNPGPPGTRVLARRARRGPIRRGRPHLHPRRAATAMRGTTAATTITMPRTTADQEAPPPGTLAATCSLSRRRAPASNNFYRAAGGRIFPEELPPVHLPPSPVRRRQQEARVAQQAKGRPRTMPESVGGPRQAMVFLEHRSSSRCMQF